MPRQFQHPFQESQFDIFEWYPRFQSCHRFFIEHAQHTNPVQAVAALVNIQLPFEKISNQSSAATPSPSSSSGAGHGNVALVPFIRRLVATGFDTPSVLHGFFGDDWSAGIGPIHEQERRNYLFAAKSETWLKVKADYDMENGQSVPFLRPLQGVTEKEIVNAEANWSDWLAMQDWMLGPRAPPGENDSHSSRGSGD
ncbi:hypothetical protein J3458_012831 [Metarhizium acridum]|uniref:Ilp is an apoptosis inhibitor n=1 Tax=Metarhizium acridum (strain CQMa 102) TaxID=655827 RepID=E9DXR5_METAQ|nr:uncharacterized protein MAC_02413 [Metarhizium acridum CQMa 102]EFY91528.1 hypothetical protein MAC_02413 [Metarhizium acridum CQMa 102]KAG8413245.1 hypothetical protein J3458_012831 [Metarhizium acridum]